MPTSQFAPMDALFYYTGKLVWLALVLLTFWFIIEVIIGFVTAVSWARWVYFSAKTHGHPLRWHRFPESFLVQWFDLIGHRNRGAVTISSREGGIWRGIGDWSVGMGRIEVAPFDPEPSELPRP